MEQELRNREIAREQELKKEQEEREREYIKAKEDYNHTAQEYYDELLNHKKGIGFTALGLLFQIITLPVEFNASSRAKKELNKMHLVNSNEAQGVSKMLYSAAMTYVAGVLASVMQIIRLLLITRNRD